MGWLISEKTYHFLVIFLSLSQELTPTELIDRHQLCRKFDWVGDTQIRYLSPSVSALFNDCVNIKLYPVPKSSQIYATVSVTNRYKCADYKIEKIVLTLLTLPNLASLEQDGVAVGTWFKLKDGIKRSVLPPRFPTAYLENNNNLSVVSCFDISNKNDEDYPVLDSDIQPNCIFFQGQLKPGNGFAAKADINILAQNPVPVQVSGEFVLKIGATGDTWYWIYNGGSRELTYNPRIDTVYFSGNPTKRQFFLRPEYYENKPIQPNNRKNSKHEIEGRTQTTTESNYDEVSISSLSLRQAPGPSPPPPPPSSTTTTTTPAPPPLRNTYMCSCLDPRRAGGSIATNPNDTISDLGPVPTDPKDTLLGCFDFKLADCKGSLTDERLGAIFIQKPCPAQPTVKTVDISFVAFNQYGYPYGELVANKLVRPCFSQASTAASHLTVIHDLKAVPYDCPGYPYTSTLYKAGSKWLSVEADFEVGAGQKPRAVQVMFKSRINSGSPIPSDIQMVAEFTVEMTPGGTKETRRILTDRRKLKFTNNQLDFGGSSVQSTPIAANPVYLTETAPLTCKAPAACTNCPSLNPNRFLCRDLGADSNPSVSVSDAIEPCLRTQFKYDARRIFLVSLEKDDSSMACGDKKIIQSVFMVLERDKAGVRVAGSWSRTNSSDFAKCKPPGSTATAYQPYLKYNIDSCAVVANDYQLFHSYKFIDDKLFCGRWTWASKTLSTKSEFQAGIKIYYSSGTNLHTFVYRIPEIYDVLSSTSSFTTEEIVVSPNKRTDILWSTNPVTPPLTPPPPRKSQMCQCVTPRRQGGPALNPATFTIIDVVNGSAADTCFEFKFANCPDSHTSEWLGAVFVMKEACPVGIKLVDISVIAINQNGYPYGRVDVNKHMKMCFDTGNPYEDILKVKTVVNDMGPIYYVCSEFPVSNSDTLFEKPQWISIDANVESEASPFSGFEGTVFQFVLVDTVKTASGSYPAPTHLQFIAEFGVSTGGNYQVYRLRTEQLELKFAANNKVDYKGSTAVTTPSPDITLDVEYMAERKINCGNPAKPPPSNTNPSWTTCHCFKYESPPQTNPANAAQKAMLQDCLSVTFNYDPSITSVNTFFVSIAKKSPIGANCADVKIPQFVLTMLGRDKNGNGATMISQGRWSTADMNTDYVPGKCLPTGSTASDYNPQKTGKAPTKACADSSGQPNSLYFYYRSLPGDGDVHCGKWEMWTPSPFQEIQVLYKLEFLNASSMSTRWNYVARYPLIYEYKTGIVEEISVTNASNPKADVLHSMAPYKPTSKCLSTPFVPSSDICDCTEYRHIGFNQIPDRTMVDNISNANPPISSDCFNFTIVPCTIEGNKWDTIGALLIINTPSSTPPCNDDILVEDASFMALNEDGYPFGEPKYSEFTRACLEPTNLLGYTIKNYDYSRPVGGRCDNRNRSTGGPYTWEYKYGGVIPTWIQVGIEAEVRRLEKPIAVQIYLDKPTPTSSATKVQFITEMLISYPASGQRKIYSLRTEVYNIAYNTGTWIFDVGGLAVDSTLSIIEREDDYYETEDYNRVCHKPRPPVYFKKPLPIQQCACFTFTDGIPANGTQMAVPPTGTLLNSTDSLYIDKLSKCVFFEWAPYVQDFNIVYFYLTVWTKTAAEEAVCGDFQVIGTTLTPLMRLRDGEEQIGFPFSKWHRITMPAPGFVMTSTDKRLAMGQYCNLGSSYSGKLRRPPYFWGNDPTLTDCTKIKILNRPGNKNLYLHYYPLMHQPDDRNAFCTALQLDNITVGAAIGRVEFQIVGYFFMEFNAPTAKYYAMKRTSVFEYIQDQVPKPPPTWPPGSPPTIPPPPPVPTASTINFPGIVIAVQEADQNPNDCDTSVCLYP